MSKLLFHVSDEKYDILKPQSRYGRRSCICFSSDKFISNFGQYVYIFLFKTLNNVFRIDIIDSGGLNCLVFMAANESTYRFKSRELGDEYRIYQPIDVDKYSVGVGEHWNHAEGDIETLVRDKVVNSERVNLGEDA